MKTHRHAGSLLAFLALAASAPALAQSRGAAAVAPAPTPAPMSASPSPRGASESDSERALGSWALVVFNTQPFDFPNTGGATPIPLTVYTVGLRHWGTQPWEKFRAWGWDLGVGMVVGRGSVTQPQTGTLTTSDGPSVTGYGLHAGLPLAVTLHRHALFELVPEANLVYARETIPALTVGGEATEYRGWSLRAGVRAGFEVFFGFVDLPQLAIEASVGASASWDSVTSTVGPIERSSRRWTFQTLRGTEPWSVFTGSVAAMYHF